MISSDDRDEEQVHVIKQGCLTVQQHLIVLRKADIASDTQQLQLQLNGQYGFEQLLKEVTCNMVAASWQRMLQSEKQLLGQKRTMSQSSIILPSNPRFYELTSLL